MEKANANEITGASVTRGSNHCEGAEAHGNYFVQCFDSNGNLKWEDTIENVVCTEGKNSALTSVFKGSSFTQVAMMGLIGNTTYSTPVAGNTAAAINTTGSANNWNEATSAVSAARKDLTTSNQFGTPSAGSVSTSAQAFAITGTDTINGCFVLIKSAAGVSPTTAVANTSGALWSAGAFTGGAKAVASGDTLNVTYTTSL